MPGKSALVGGKGVHASSPTLDGTALTVSRPTGTCVTLSNFPFPSKVMDHSIE